MEWWWWRRRGLRTANDEDGDLKRVEGICQEPCVQPALKQKAYDIPARAEYGSPFVFMSSHLCLFENREKKTCHTISKPFVPTKCGRTSKTVNPPHRSILWSRLSSLLPPPPGTSLHFYRADESAVPTLVDCSSNFANSHALAPSGGANSVQENVPTSIPRVSCALEGELEPAKSTLAATKLTH